MKREKKGTTLWMLLGEICIDDALQDHKTVAVGEDSEVDRDQY